jgi:hypothetical protein
VVAGLAVQAADAGMVMNPEQCRRQVERGVAQAIGSAPYEEMRLSLNGVVITKDLRNYHIPQLADVPVTEIYFADTYDELAIGREVDERVAVRPGGAGGGQRHCPRAARGCISCR